MSSGTVLAGTDGFTTITLGKRMRPATVAMSRMKLWFSFFVERRVDRVRWCDQEERIAVRRRIHDGLGRDIGARARPAFDDEWLTEPLRQPLTEQARGDVGRAAGRVADDQPHRPRRIGLRRCNPRDGWQRSGSRDQRQKSSARKLQS